MCLKFEVVSKSWGKQDTSRLPGMFSLASHTDKRIQKFMIKYDYTISIVLIFIINVVILVSLVPRHNGIYLVQNRLHSSSQCPKNISKEYIWSQYQTFSFKWSLILFSNNKRKSFFYLVAIICQCFSSFINKKELKRKALSPWHKVMN